MCNEIKRCAKTIRCAKDNKMCKKQQDVQKTIRCKKKKKTVYWDLINSNEGCADGLFMVMYIEQQ